MTRIERLSVANLILWPLIDASFHSNCISGSEMSFTSVTPLTCAFWPFNASSYIKAGSLCFNFCRLSLWSIIFILQSFSTVHDLLFQLYIAYDSTSVLQLLLPPTFNPFFKGLFFVIAPVYNVSFQFRQGTIFSTLLLCHITLLGEISNIFFLWLKLLLLLACW